MKERCEGPAQGFAYEFCELQGTTEQDEQEGFRSRLFVALMTELPSKAFRTSPHVVGEREGRRSRLFATLMKTGPVQAFGVLVL